MTFFATCSALMEDVARCCFSFTLGLPLGNGGRRTRKILAKGKRGKQGEFINIEHLEGGREEKLGGRIRQNKNIFKQKAG